MRIGGKETKTIIAQVEFKERKQGKDEGVVKFELKEKKERNHGNSSLSSRREIKVITIGVRIQGEERGKRS